MSRSPSRALDRRSPAQSYGWSDAGKTPAEIASDIEQTRYRLDADLSALKDMFQPKRIVPIAAGLGLALLGLLVRRLRRSRR